MNSSGAFAQGKTVRNEGKYEDNAYEEETVPGKC